MLSWLLGLSRAAWAFLRSPAGKTIINELEPFFAGAAGKILASYVSFVKSTAQSLESSQTSLTGPQKFESLLHALYLKMASDIKAGVADAESIAKTVGITVASTAAAGAEAYGESVVSQLMAKVTGATTGTAPASASLSGAMEAILKPAIQAGKLELQKQLSA